MKNCFLMLSRLKIIHIILFLGRGTIELCSMINVYCLSIELLSNRVFSAERCVQVGVYA